MSAIVPSKTDRSIVASVSGVDGSLALAAAASSASHSATAAASKPLPAVGAIQDAVGGKQGLIENGGHTDDSRPLISGTAAAGVVVHLYRNGASMGRVTAGDDGEWSFVPRSPLVDGRQEISVTYQYPDGKVSGYSESHVIFVDTLRPAVPEILGMVDDEGRITCTVANKGITDDNQPTVNGTAEANATVIVYDKGEEIGRVEADAAGKWSFTPEPPLADGTHILSYVALDRAGNQSEMSGQFEFLVDTRPERINIYVADDDVGSITGLLLSGSATDDATPTLEGTATAGGVVKIYEGTELLGQTTAGVDGRWTFTPPTQLSEGSHALQATVTLPAKGESDRSPNFNLTIDLSGPNAPTIDEVFDNVGSGQGSLADGAVTDDATPTMKGRAEAGSTVRIYDNGNLLGSALVDANGNWSYTPAASLADGEHVFTAVAADAVGNASGSSAPHAVVVDTGAPDKPTITSVLDDAGAVKGEVVNGGSTDDRQPLISGKAEAGSTLIIRDKGVEIGRVAVEADGTWSFEPGVPLSKGGHELSVQAVDVAGNVSVPSERFDFSVVSNGDDYAVPLEVVGGPVSLNMVLDTSTSMSSVSSAAAKAAMKTTVEAYLRFGSTVIVDLQDTGARGKFTIKGIQDPAYTAFLSAVNAIPVGTSYTHQTAVTRVMDAINAEYADPNFDPNTLKQVFFFGDGINGLSDATMTKWQSMLETLSDTSPIGSAFVLVPDEPKNTGYPSHQVFVEAIVNQPLVAAPDAAKMAEVVASTLVAGEVAGNLLDNDEDVVRDGSERLTQVTFEGQVFRIGANNTLVIDNHDGKTTAVYNAASGKLTIDTAAGKLSVYLVSSGRHDAGDYAYHAKVNTETSLEGAITQVFGYVATSNTGGTQASNLHVEIKQKEGKLTLTAIGKDSGAVGDYLTADGSAGREISGTLEYKLADGLKVQVSTDGGKTWHDAVTKGTNWMYLDMTSHASSWEVQARISDGAMHGKLVQSQQVTLAEGRGAPGITRIPDAEGIYTAAKAQDGSQVLLSLSGTGAKAGDIVHIQWGITTYDQALTQVDINSGLATINVPATATYTAQGYLKDFSVTAQIISKDGAIGAVSSPYAVVGTPVKANVSDTLQKALVGDEYVGAGFKVTSTGSLSKTAATTTANAGLTLIGDAQAETTFALDKPASYFTLRLTGIDNTVGAQIQVFDVKGNLIHSENFIGGTDAKHTKDFSFTSAELVDIGSFKVVTLGASLTLDAFTQTVLTHTAETRDPNLIDYATETFAGTAGNDVASLSITSATYFNQATAAIHGGAGIDTLTLVGANHQLNLSTAGSKVSSMEIIDLTGTGNNTLTLGLSQVLENGAVNAFHVGDKSRVQLLVNGNAGDKVVLNDLLANGNDFGDWVKASAVIVNGLAYDSYQHSSLGAELLVQIGVTVMVTNSATVGVESTFGAEQIESAALPVDGAMLTLNLSQVLNEGGVDMFHEDGQGRTQMMVKGNAGDSINLDDLLADGTTDLGDWAVQGSQIVDGVAYTVYQHAGANAELLVQELVTVNLV